MIAMPALTLSRNTAQFATLTFYWGDGLTANGPYPDPEAADSAAERIMRADHTAYTYVLALLVPGADADLTLHTAEHRHRWWWPEVNDLLTLNRRLTRKIKTYTPPTDEHPGPAVVLIRSASWIYAVLAGPFPSTPEAQEWTTRRDPRAQQLRIARSTITTVLPLHPDDPTAPAQLLR